VQIQPLSGRGTVVVLCLSVSTRFTTAVHHISTLHESPLIFTVSAVSVADQCLLLLLCAERGHGIDWESVSHLSRWISRIASRGQWFVGIYRISCCICFGRISGHSSASSSGSWQSSNRIMKLDNFNYLLSTVKWEIRVSWLLCYGMDLHQYVTSSNMKLVTPSTQLSRCPSQTSTVPKLLSAHSDSVVDSTQLSICLTDLKSLSSIQLDSRFSYPTSISLRPNSENAYLVHR